MGSHCKQWEGIYMVEGGLLNKDSLEAVLVCEGEVGMKKYHLRSSDLRGVNIKLCQTQRKGVAI